MVFKLVTNTKIICLVTCKYACKCDLKSDTIEKVGHRSDSNFAMNYTFKEIKLGIKKDSIHLIFRERL